MKVFAPIQKITRAPVTWGFVSVFFLRNFVLFCFWGLLFKMLGRIRLLDSSVYSCAMFEEGEGGYTYRKTRGSYLGQELLLLCYIAWAAQWFVNEGIFEDAYEIELSYQHCKTYISLGHQNFDSPVKREAQHPVKQNFKGQLSVSHISGL